MSPYKRSRTEDEDRTTKRVKTTQWTLDKTLSLLDAMLKTDEEMIIHNTWVRVVKDTLTYISSLPNPSNKDDWDLEDIMMFLRYNMDYDDNMDPTLRVHFKASLDLLTYNNGLPCPL